jgi:hypothetical protein
MVYVRDREYQPQIVNNLSLFPLLSTYEPISLKLSSLIYRTIVCVPISESLVKKLSLQSLLQNMPQFFFIFCL